MDKDIQKQSEAKLSSPMKRWLLAILLDTLDSAAGGVTRDFERIAKRLDREDTLLTALAATVAALEILVDDEPCRHDHNGMCQTHFNVTDKGECVNVAARAALELAKPLLEAK